jgi:hypothetical protein
MSPPMNSNAPSECAQKRVQDVSRLGTQHGRALGIRPDLYGGNAFYGFERTLFNAARVPNASRLGSNFSSLIQGLCDARSARSLSLRFGAANPAWASVHKRESPRASSGWRESRPNPPVIEYQPLRAYRLRRELHGPPSPLLPAASNFRSRSGRNAVDSPVCALQQVSSSLSYSM